MNTHTHTQEMRTWKNPLQTLWLRKKREGKMEPRESMRKKRESARTMVESFKRRARRWRKMLPRKGEGLLWEFQR